ncbi:MAG: hypothetical protein KGK04_12775, partial [Xanthomonadaceae bacterium]|nr:hypothetical protein [Xanthomonadaceae bacterium]
PPRVLFAGFTVYLLSGPVLTLWGLAVHRRRARRGGGAADVANAECVVLLPAACGARELDLLGRALNSGGATLARAARVRVQPGEAEIAVPHARAYLACGEAQAHALGRSLPMQVTAQAQIVLVDEPARLLDDAAAKRRLWIALRTLQRSLAEGR